MRAVTVFTLASLLLLTGGAHAASESQRAVPALVSGTYSGTLASLLSGSFVATITVHRAPPQIGRYGFASGTLALRGRTSCSAKFTAQNRVGSIWFVFVNASSGPCAVNRAPGAVQTLTVIDGRHLKADLGLMGGTLALVHRPTPATAPSQAALPKFPWCKERTSITLSKTSGPPGTSIGLSFSHPAETWDGFSLYVGAKTRIFYGGGYPTPISHTIRGTRGQRVTFTLVRGYNHTADLIPTCISASKTFTITG